MWTIFLHPSQQALEAKNYSGPARVSGSTGTGKTVVALHRAVHLVRTDPEVRFLLTTFSNALATALKKIVHRLIKHEPILGERLDVEAMDSLAHRLLSARQRNLKIATRQLADEVLLA